MSQSNYYKLIEPDLKKQSNSAYLKDLLSAKANSEFSFKKTKKQKDKTGIYHSRYQQLYQGTAINFATVNIHHSSDALISVHGYHYDEIIITNEILLNQFEAFEKAKYYFPSNKFVEKQTKRPFSNLLLVSENFYEHSVDQQYAYHFSIQSYDPIFYRDVYINAEDGSLIYSVNKIHSNHIVEGTANTKYHGEQKIETLLNDEGQYVLRDTTRGEGIFTLNVQNNFGDFIDDDNYWNNFNPQQDEVATDVHFCTAATFDFYNDAFGLESFDGDGALINCMVHNFGSNAFWNGEFMIFGDGDNERFGPFTSIDVVGHEFTHAVIQNSSNLIYSRESGAINEALCDIFGKTIEQHVFPNEFSWQLGEKFTLNDTSLIRSMKNPYLGKDPKLYKGLYWDQNELEGGKVHINSGVMNHWFYLLVEGISGTNEIGKPFSVEALGFEQASEIAFWAMQYYLSENSNYRDAREATLFAASQLHGVCSDIFKQVASAWWAVGIGFEINENDFGISVIDGQVDRCVIDDMKVSIALNNNGCVDSLDAGKLIKVFYQLDNGTPVEEAFTNDNSLLAGEQITHEFNNKVTVTGEGQHELKVWFELEEDVYAVNDTAVYKFNVLPYENTDIELFNTIYRGPICRDDNERVLESFFIFKGCDTLEVNQEIPYSLIYNNQDITETFTLNKQLGNDEFVSNNSTIFLEEYGFGRGLSEVNFMGDTVLENNNSAFYLAKIKYHIEEYLETFEDFDSSFVAILERPNSNAVVDTDSKKLITIGGDILNDDGDLLVFPFDNPNIFFQVHERFQTELIYCLDIPDFNNPRISFDLQHLYSNYLLDTIGAKQGYSNMAGIMIDGKLQDTIYFDSLRTEVERNIKFDLTPYKDAPFELRIKSLAIFGDLDEEGQVQNVQNSDRNLIDNIRIYDSDPVGIQEQSLLSKYILAPNPSINGFKILNPSKINLDYHLKIYGVNGALASKHFVAPTSQKQIFGEDLDTGFYIVHLENEFGTQIFKWAKY